MNHSPSSKSANYKVPFFVLLVVCVLLAAVLTAVLLPERSSDAFFPWNTMEGEITDVLSGNLTIRRLRSAPRTERITILMSAPTQRSMTQTASRCWLADLPRACASRSLTKILSSLPNSIMKMEQKPQPSLVIALKYRFFPEQCFSAAQNFGRRLSKYKEQGGENVMICPYCNQEMTAGHVEKERYALKWIPEENSRGRFLDWLPWTKGIKLMKKGSCVKMHYCNTCEKFIINMHEIV